MRQTNIKGTQMKKIEVPIHPRHPNGNILKNSNVKYNKITEFMDVWISDRNNE